MFTLVPYAGVNQIRFDGSHLRDLSLTGTPTSFQFGLYGYQINLKVKLEKLVINAI